MWGQKFIQFSIILFITYVCTILLIFKTSGWLFKIEFFVFLLFILVSFLFMLGLFVEERWGYVVGFMLFLLVLVNLLVMKFLLAGNLAVFAIAMIAALIGFIICIANMKKEPLEVPEPVPEHKILPYGVGGKKAPAKNQRKRKKR